VRVAEGRATARLLDWALLVGCNLIWASQFVLAKMVQERMGPVFATFVPMTLATLILIPIVLGHNDPELNAAVETALKEPTSLMGAGTTPWEIDLAYRRALLERGVFHFPLACKQGSISAAHTDEDLAFTLDVTRQALKSL
jgi:hypothetical protein